MFFKLVKQDINGRDLDMPLLEIQTFPGWARREIRRIGLDPDHITRQKFRSNVTRLCNDV